MAPVLESAKDAVAATASADTATRRVRDKSMEDLTSQGGSDHLARPLLSARPDPWREAHITDPELLCRGPHACLRLFRLGIVCTPSKMSDSPA